MDKYKKKSLNFMGFSRELRKNQIDYQRSLSRHQRFSIIRPLEEEENNETPNKGKSDIQAGSRVELLQKWKQEKIRKKQQESKLKKPAFKVGVNKPDPCPSDGNKPLFALDTSSRLYKSSFLVSNSVFAKKQEHLNASKTKPNAKLSNSRSSTKKTEVDAVNIKTCAKVMNIQPSKLAPKKPESKCIKNKESGIQSFTLKTKVDVTSRVVNKDKLPNIRKLPTPVSKPIEIKKIPSSGLPKPTAIRTFSKVSDRQIPEKKNGVKTIPKFSKIAAPQQRGNISEKIKKSDSNVPNKTDNDLKLNAFECELSRIETAKEPRKSFAPEGFMFQPPTELSSSLFLENGPSAIFMRMKSQFLRTSTPKRSPESKQSSSKIENNECLKNTDIESLRNENHQSPKKEDIQSLIKENIPCLKKEDILCPKEEGIQCSKQEGIQCPKEEGIQCPKEEGIQCPKEEGIQCPREEGIQCPREEGIQCPREEGIQCPKLEGIQCPKEEDIQCPKEEDIQCSKIKNKEFGPLNKYDFETILSSSLESVVLNDMKLADCQQSHKFECPEVGLTHNQKELLLPSKSIHSEFLLEAELPPADNVKPLILIDSVETDEGQINFTDVTSADNGEISVFFSEESIAACEEKEILDSAPVEPNEMVMNIQDMTNGFLRKQETGPLKILEVKNQKFRRSQKPGLASINESLENTPKSALKKKFLDNALTPRRSLRLAKLSGNSNSLDNLLVSFKPKENKASLKENFTPRRSSRLSKFSTDFNSAENLFEVTRPTFYGSPEEDEVVPKLSSRVTYDFDRLSSEEESCPRITRSGKISLLYTPPNKSRPSIMRQSIKGDLMSFSPNV